MPALGDTGQTPLKAKRVFKRQQNKDRKLSYFFLSRFPEGAE